MIALGRVLVLLLWVALSVPGCKERYVVGDHVLVEWEDNVYPAVIVRVDGPARYRVHYDGYDPIWDQNVNVTRIKGRVKGEPPVPPPPAKVVRRGGAPPSAVLPDGGAAKQYQEGQKVRVQWNGRVYRATIVEVVERDKYRVHYDGFGPEWDETVSAVRIKR